MIVSLPFVGPERCFKVAPKGASVRVPVNHPDACPSAPHSAKSTVLRPLGDPQVWEGARIVNQRWRTDERSALRRAHSSLRDRVVASVCP